MTTTVDSLTYFFFVMHTKYSDLVWYGRQTPDDCKIKVVDKMCQEIEALWPKETAEMQSKNVLTASNAMQFNTGCLAGLRLAYDLLLYHDQNTTTQEIIDAFPDVDA